MPNERRARSATERGRSPSAARGNTEVSGNFRPGFLCDRAATVDRSRSELRATRPSDAPYHNHSCPFVSIRGQNKMTTDAKIFSALRSAENGGVSGADL